MTTTITETRYVIERDRRFFTYRNENFLLDKWTPNLGLAEIYFSEAAAKEDSPSATDRILPVTVTTTYTIQD